MFNPNKNVIRKRVMAVIEGRIQKAQADYEQVVAQAEEAFDDQVRELRVATDNQIESDTEAIVAGVFKA